MMRGPATPLAYIDRAAALLLGLGKRILTDNCYRLDFHR
jgi:hypothetical protein